MNAFPKSIQFRDPKEHLGRKIEASLGIIAADLTTETKVVFPAMAELYFKSKIEKGRMSIQEGRILTQEEVEKKMMIWAKSIGQK